MQRVVYHQERERGIIFVLQSEAHFSLLACLVHELGRGVDDRVHSCVAWLAECETRPWQTCEPISFLEELRTAGQKAPQEYPQEEVQMAQGLRA